MFASRTNWRLEPNRLAIALEAHRRRGKPLFDLTNSNPTTCGFRYPEERFFAAMRDRRALRYEPESKGLRSAREAIADYYRGRPGFSGAEARVDPEQTVITSGTSEAYDYVFRLLCEAGDEVLAPAPSYPLFDYLADLADVRPVPYRLFYDQGWQIDFAGLESALTKRSKAVIVVHPNNPTGSFIKKAEAQRLAEVCAPRGIAIVADEVFLDYADGREPQSTFAHGSAALTFAFSGLSKISLLPQMKIAWIVVNGPESLARAAMQRLEVIGDTYLSPSTPAQLALPEMLAVRDELQTQMRQRLSSNLAFLDGVFQEAGAVTRLKCEGGWYAVLRVPATGSDEDLAIALLEECDVLVHPGHFFDFAGDGYLIVSLIAREDEFQNGVRALHDFFVRKS
jgi:alanine-synthesizing transaminase